MAIPPLVVGTINQTQAGLPPKSGAAKLKEACDEAYRKYPNACNQSVLHVIHALVDKNFSMLDANGLLRHLGGLWKSVTETEAQAFADAGRVVVAGASGNPNGHVVIVYPGGMKNSGGYQFVKNGKAMMAADHGKFPRAMSTSIGTWPGGKSCGDKTVFDSWASKESYKSVKYYAAPVQ